LTARRPWAIIKPRTVTAGLEAMKTKGWKKKKARQSKFWQFGLSLLSCWLVIWLAYQLCLIELWGRLVSGSNLVKTLSYPLLMFFFLLLAGWLFRAGLWLFYHPVVNSGRKDKAWPLVSVIMPAYNEEKGIGRAIEAVLSSDYPEEALELICVNDGSTDGTSLVLNKMKTFYKDRLKIVEIKKNQGKKRALALGLKEARGEIIITTDADSEVHRQAIKNLILPLMNDSRVGAVAGKVLVLNEKKNLLTRMLAAQYLVSFDFGRAYQSVYGGVLCCPGALSAFRRSLLKKIIRPWLNQKFLKVECKHGEDRALTNLVIRKGYQVKYQANAVVYTRVPERLARINRMYLRWTRGYVRENWLLIRYFWQSQKPGHYLLAVVDSLLQMLMHPFHLLLVSLLLYSFLRYPGFIVNQLFFLLMLSLIYSLNHFKPGRGLRFIYGIPQSVFVFFCQWWMVPYALITVKDQDWLTK